VQPTGNLHLGNYLGAIRNFARLQNDYDCLYCVVDLHAITQPQDPKLLASQTREIAAAFLAAGVDGKKQIIFNQSMVPAHAQLAWCSTAWPGSLDEPHDAVQGEGGQGPRECLVGPLRLPGADGGRHPGLQGHPRAGRRGPEAALELTRDIAIKFNNDFNAPEFFPITEPLIFGAATRVMSLRDGTKKMSKSDPSDYSRINLTDDADAIAQKIRRAKTDPLPMPESEADAEKRPDADNLLGIYAALADREKADIVREFAGKQFSEFKAALTELAVAKLGPVGAEMQRLMKDPGHVDAVLRDGAERAAALAAPILAEVYRTVGFLKP